MPEAVPKRPGVYVTGLRERVKSLQNLGASLDEMKDAFALIADDAAIYMRKYVPDESGTLRSTVRGSRAKARASVQIGRARVPYAGPINYGWQRHNIRGRRFVARFDAAYSNRALELITESLNDLAQKYGATDE